MFTNRFISYNTYYKYNTLFESSDTAETKFTYSFR